MPLHESIRVVILAAGKGTRMKQPIPKALTPLKGKPIIQFLLESIQASGLDSTPIVVVSPQFPTLCDKLGVSCVYAMQAEQLGTGHALSCALPELVGADYVIVLNGDQPFVQADTLRRLATTHLEEQRAVSLMTTIIPSFEEGWFHVFRSWGRIVRDTSGALDSIVEYKDTDEQQKAITELNPSVFMFRVSWLREHIQELQNHNSQGEFYMTDLVAVATHAGEFVGTLSVEPEEVIGINTPEEREVAEMLLR